MIGFTMVPGFSPRLCLQIILLKPHLTFLLEALRNLSDIMRSSNRRDAICVQSKKIKKMWIL